MWWWSGHLGASVSALVDGQLEGETAERAWRHVLECPDCRRLVEREGWVKRQLSAMGCGGESAPPEHLIGSLHELPVGAEDWADLDDEDRQRWGRRAAWSWSGLARSPPPCSASAPWRPRRCRSAPRAAPPRRSTGR